LLGDGSSDHNRQVANCYVEGLQLQPFHDPYVGNFEWFESFWSHICEVNEMKTSRVKGLESNVDIVKEELELFLARNQKFDIFLSKTKI